MAQETLMTLADPKGLEPLIFCSVDRRLIQLGYGSIILLYRVFLKIKILKFQQNQHSLMQKLVN